MTSKQVMHEQFQKAFVSINEIITKLEQHAIKTASPLVGEFQAFIAEGFMPGMKHAFQCYDETYKGLKSKLWESYGEADFRYHIVDFITYASAFKAWGKELGCEAEIKENLEVIWEVGDKYIRYGFEGYKEVPTRYDDEW